MQKSTHLVNKDGSEGLFYCEVCYEYFDDLLKLEWHKENEHTRFRQIQTST